MEIYFDRQNYPTTQGANLELCIHHPYQGKKQTQPIILLFLFMEQTFRNGSKGIKNVYLVLKESYARNTCKKQ